MISDKANNNQLAKAVGYTFTIFLTIIFLYLAFRGIDLKKSFYIISKSSIVAILLYVLVFFISHYARAVRWKYIISPMKKDVSTFHLFGSVMVGYGVNCVVPRLGELYRGLFLGRWEKISRTTAIGTIVVERIIDMASFAFAALVSVSIFSGNLYSEITWLKTSLVIGFMLISSVTIFLIVLVRYRENFRNGLVRITGKLSTKLSFRLKEIFDTLISGLSSIKGRKNILIIVAGTIVILILYALNTYIGFYVLGMESTGKITFAIAWIVMTISSFSTMVPTPGGVGSYHAISIFVLTQLFKFDNESSAAYAILTHFISYFVFILSTVVIIYFVNRRRMLNGLSRETFLSVFKVTPDEK